MEAKGQKSNNIFQAVHGRNVSLNHDLPEAMMFGLYARSFHLAGRHIYQRMCSRPGTHDIDACPIVFNYRHSLELYLKSIVRFGRRYADHSGIDVQINDDVLMGSHVPSRFLQAVGQTFKSAGWIWETEIDGLRTFADFQDRIREFDQVDQGSYAFRYPVDKDGNPYHSNEFSMSMETFCRNMDKLLYALDTAVSGLGAELGQIEEIDAEMQDLY